MRWPPPSKPGEVNHASLDRFTFVHASVGVACALAGMGFAWTCALGLAWEIAENPLKAYLPRLFPNATSDTLRNSVVDVLAVVGGWGVMQLVR